MREHALDGAAAVESDGLLEWRALKVRIATTVASVVGHLGLGAHNVGRVVDEVLADGLEAVLDANGERTVADAIAAAAAAARIGAHLKSRQRTGRGRRGEEARVTPRAYGNGRHGGGRAAIVAAAVAATVAVVVVVVESAATEVDVCRAVLDEVAHERVEALVAREAQERVAVLQYFVHVERRTLAALFNGGHDRLERLVAATQIVQLLDGRERRRRKQRFVHLVH